MALSETQRKQILEMALPPNSMKASAIASELDIAVSTVYNFLQTQGFSHKEDKPPLDEEQIVKEYQDETVRIPTLLAKHQIHYGTLYGILRKFNIPLREVVVKENRQAQLDHAIKLYKEGVSVFEIKSITGVSTFSLYTELRRRSMAPDRVKPVSLEPLPEEEEEKKK